MAAGALTAEAWALLKGSPAAVSRLKPAHSLPVNLTAVRDDSVVLLHPVYVLDSAGIRTATQQAA